jgi:hypothetical protein
LEKITEPPRELLGFFACEHDAFLPRGVDAELDAAKQGPADQNKTITTKDEPTKQEIENEIGISDGYED